jgi:transposase-like protein
LIAVVDGLKGFYAFPREVRRILYTTNAIEALNAKLRRAVRARVKAPEQKSLTESTGSPVAPE